MTELEPQVIGCRGAVNLLARRLDDPEAEAVSERVGTHLMIRNSCGRTQATQQIPVRGTPEPAPDQD